MPLLLAILLHYLLLPPRCRWLLLLPAESSLAKVAMLLRLRIRLKRGGRRPAPSRVKMGMGIPAHNPSSPSALSSSPTNCRFRRTTSTSAALYLNSATTATPR
ncbi:uncharacterized protein LOC125545434 [Triticum urartu]|uniref:uncharacterized protein LOC125523982 n=1 Tax=Triticum urartu TaxID=4572 RepID=UPI002043E4F8|nr:uncharacterized protein LOC125523982 [Triticum urartu]XP_048565237.1 uncharacterized protein LOC125545364 [Triticum urartu]XP_048565324.1 uncharacterized protein LOC125545434 [Triticum urartu]